MRFTVIITFCQKFVIFTCVGDRKCKVRSAINVSESQLEENQIDNVRSNK